MLLHQGWYDRDDAFDPQYSMAKQYFSEQHSISTPELPVSPQSESEETQNRKNLLQNSMRSQIDFHDIPFIQTGNALLQR